MRNRHFNNISFVVGVQSLNLYGFLGFSGDLRGILVDYVELGDSW